MGIVSAIVPARNEEANIARVVQSLAAQPEIDEIIVVDDQSTDRTPAILTELAARHPQLRALRASDPPPGWLGKTHALWLGAAQARGEWLLFTDADTEHLPGSTARALADAARRSAELVSYSPEQEMHTWWEKALIPFVFCRLDLHFSYERINRPVCREAAANGQFLFVNRAAYLAAGGHETVAGAVLDDVELARRFRACGMPIFFAPGRNIVRARMYRTFTEMWAGWRKNLYLLIGGRWPRLIQELLLTSPWPLALLAAQEPVLFYAGLYLPLLATTRYAQWLQSNGYSLWLTFCLPLAAVLYPAVLLASAAAHARGVVAWKGREYPVASR
jgi:glycosyltransferase involved in cell wall biosynthesis